MRLLLILVVTSCSSVPEKVAAPIAEPSAKKEKTVREILEESSAEVLEVMNNVPKEQQPLCKEQVCTFRTQGSWAGWDYVEYRKNATGAVDSTTIQVGHHNEQRRRYQEKPADTNVLWQGKHPTKDGTVTVAKHFAMDELKEKGDNTRSLLLYQTINRNSVEIRRARNTVEIPGYCNDSAEPVEGRWLKYKGRYFLSVKVPSLDNMGCGFVEHLFWGIRFPVFPVKSSVDSVYFPSKENKFRWESQGGNLLHTQDVCTGGRITEVRRKFILNRTTLVEIGTKEVRTKRKCSLPA